MNNVIQFPNSDIKDYRSKCVFMNRGVQVEGEDVEKHTYPCIVLYEEETDVPVLYTGLERYLCNLVKSELLNGKTLSHKAYAVCHFLNYLLKETDINSIHECSLETIRGFLKYIKMQDNGKELNRGTWLRYRDYVVDFLILYYSYNRDVLPFNYEADELKRLTIVKDDKHHKKAVIARNSSMHISAPKTTHKKNRILVDGYLDFLLHEWQATINARTTNKSGCPYCSGRKAIPGLTDLKTLLPEIAIDWNYEKNRGKIPKNYTRSSDEKVWWKCCECGYEWRSCISTRAQGHSNCRRCSK